MDKKQGFHGWWIVAAGFITFGLSTGLPYYNIGFFYDYLVEDYGWARSEVTAGFGIAALLLIWFGPVVVPRFQPRTLIIAGTGISCLAFVFFGMNMTALWVYYGIWLLYYIGYVSSGPIPHQVLMTNWFRKNRGLAMGILYLGIPALGISGNKLMPYLTSRYDYKTAIYVAGLMLLIAWPITLLLHRNKPADLGQHPDGEEPSEEFAAEIQEEPKSIRYLLRQKAFWLLLLGSALSIGSIGAINFNIKFVLQDQGFVDQAQRDAVWASTSIFTLLASVGGRLLVGWLADRFPRKYVMLGTYVLVASTIPILLLVRPESPEFIYIFAILFGFGMGADYMIIPLMAADLYGLNSLKRSMSVILPADTIGQTWLPVLVARLGETIGYGLGLWVIFGLAMVGALAIALLPRDMARKTAAVAGH